MSGARRGGFASRPTNADTWVRASEAGASAPPDRPDGRTARLTIDVTPRLRARIKVAAFRRGLTVADAVRTLLEREFPEDGSAS